MFPQIDGALIRQDLEETRSTATTADRLASGLVSSRQVEVVMFDIRRVQYLNHDNFARVVAYKFASARQSCRFCPLGQLN